MRKLKQTTSADNRITIFTDGSALPTNPGSGGAGFIVYQNGTVVDAGGIYLGDGVSNNAAEYAGLIAGLESAAAKGFQAIEVFCDSQLIVEQSTNRWRVKKPHLKPYHAQVRGLLVKFKYWSLGWTSRENNTVADRLANAAAVQKQNVTLGDVEQADNWQDERATRILNCIGDFMRERQKENNHV